MNQIRNIYGKAAHDDVEHDILYQLEYSASKQADSCSKKSDKLIYVMFLSAWGFLFKSSSDTDKFILGITVILAVFYFACKIFRLYRFSAFARNMFKRILKNEVSYEEAHDLYNKKSDWTFYVLEIQLVILVLMVISLCFYVIKLLW